MDVEQTIRDYLPDILHLSLATSINNKPWVTEVHFVYDYNLNLYFRSTATRRHSQEISQNPNVSGSIVTQHGATDKPRGLYFEGVAEVLHNVTEQSPEYLLFAERLGLGSGLIADAQHVDGHQFYKITVSDWYLFDARETKPSQKYHWSPV